MTASFEHTTIPFTKAVPVSLPNGELALPNEEDRCLEEDCGLAMPASSDSACYPRGSRANSLLLLL